MVSFCRAPSRSNCVNFRTASRYCTIMVSPSAALILPRVCPASTRLPVASVAKNSASPTSGNFGATTSACSRSATAANGSPSPRCMFASVVSTLTSFGTSDTDARQGCNGFTILLVLQTFLSRIGWDCVAVQRRPANGRRVQVFSPDDVWTARARLPGREHVGLDQPDYGHLADTEASPQLRASPVRLVQYARFRDRSLFLARLGSCVSGAASMCGLLRIAYRSGSGPRRCWHPAEGERSLRQGVLLPDWSSSDAALHLKHPPISYLMIPMQ